MRISLQRHIDAPIETVFAAVAKVGRFAGDADGLAGIENLKRQGAGGAAREPFRPGGPRGAPALQVTEYQPPERVGIVSEQRGTRWETLFSVQPAEGGTLLAMVMTARAGNLLSRAVLPFMRASIRRSIERDIDAVKAWCETGPQQGR